MAERVVFFVYLVGVSEFSGKAKHLGIPWFCFGAVSESFGEGSKVDSGETTKSIWLPYAKKSGS